MDVIGRQPVRRGIRLPAAVGRTPQDAAPGRTEPEIPVLVDLDADRIPIKSAVRNHVITATIQDSEIIPNNRAVSDFIELGIFLDIYTDIAVRNSGVCDPQRPVYWRTRIMHTDSGAVEAMDTAVIYRAVCRFTGPINTAP